jgi:hypothetical protein
MPNRDRDKSVEQWLRQTPVAGARVGDCLDAETLAVWSEGLLEGRARSTAEAHAASCARCQAMLPIMVRTTPAPAGAIGSPLRKWLMMLSPAMAAAAAVALWVAVDRRPVPSVNDELAKGQAKVERAAEVAQVASAPAVGAEKEVDRKAPGASLERDAPQLTADARRELRSRTGARADTGATTPLNERTEEKDVASARRADKSRDAERPPAVAEPAAPPPPPPPPASPVARSAPVESVAVAVATPPVKVAPPGPAPVQQANQAPNQNQAQTQNQNQAQSPNQNQAQTQNQNQAGQRQQAPGTVEERVIVTSEQPRAAGDNAAVAKSAGRGGAGAAGGFADASVLRARANAGAFDIAVPESSTRWRVVDGRTIQRSLDAGVTWANHHTGENDLTLTAGAAPSSNVCWLVGRSGTILLTTDGRAWRRLKFIETADLTAVTSPDARTARVTTADGRQFGTTDGGRTWTRR